MSPYFTNWTMAIGNPDCFPSRHRNLLVIIGNIHNHPNFDNGTPARSNSIEGASETSITTESGTTYKLVGPPCHDFDQWKAQTSSQFQRVIAGYTPSQDTFLYYVQKILLADPPAELTDLEGVMQDPTHHPEGDAFTHTKHVINAAIERAQTHNLSAPESMLLIYAALCHDFGKATTTKMEIDGRITSKGHDKAGAEPTRALLSSIGVPPAKIEQIVALVENHMAHAHIGSDPSDRAIRRLEKKLADVPIQIWDLLIQSDHAGRPPLPPNNPAQQITARLIKQREIAKGKNR